MGDVFGCLVGEVVPPLLEVRFPLNNSFVSGVVTVFVVVNDSSGVEMVEFYVDGGLVYVDFEFPYEWDWDTTNYTDGLYVLGVRAYDVFLNVNSTSILVFVDNTVPNVEITFPFAGGYVRGTISFVVFVEDEGSGIGSVSFGVDGIVYGLPLFVNDSRFLYEYSIDTSLFFDGLHNFTVMVFDRAGNRKTMSITFYVDNTRPSISGVYFPYRVGVGEEVLVNVTVFDVVSGVSSVILSYSVDGGDTWINVTMRAKGGGVFEAVIPGQAVNTVVLFKVMVFDVAGNVAVSSTYSYRVVSDVMPFGVFWTLMVVMGVVVVMIVAVVFMMARRGEFGF